MKHTKNTGGRPGIKKWIICFMIGWLMQGCSTSKDIFVSKEFEANSRSSVIDLRSFKDQKVHLLGYQVYSDTFVKNNRYDSLLNLGILFSRQEATVYNTAEEMQFGNDSMQCLVRYSSFVKSMKTEPAIVRPRSSTQLPQQQEENKITDVRITGIIFYPDSLNKTYFAYSNYGGSLMIPGTDSFTLKPVYQGNWKLAKTLIGVQLVKKDVVYGAVYSFTGIGRRKAFLYTKATAAEQLIIAAYFAVIGRYL